jgi:hypothetical protein
MEMTMVVLMIPTLFLTGCLVGEVIKQQPFKVK